MVALRNALAGASALALLSLPVAAQAQPMPVFGGFVWGQYGTGESDGYDADVWSGGGSAAFGVYQNIHLQGDIAFHTSDIGGGDSLDVWTFGGSAFWRGPNFAFGANIGNMSIEVDPIDFDVMNYGAFGEFYANQFITVYALGGGLDGDFGFDGMYLGGGATGYVLPNASLSANISFADFDSSDSTEFGVAGEYMFSETLPVSVYAGYSYVDADAGDGVNVWTIGMRFLFGAVGPLVERDRTGAVRHTGPAAIRF
jgi:hypothetical protein